MLLQAASTRQIPAVMHPVAAVKQRAFMMVAYFGYLVAAFANVPPPGGVALGPVFAGRRIHHPDNDCPSSSATTEADSPAVPHVFVSAAQPYRNGSETMAAFGRFRPITTGRNRPIAADGDRQNTANGRLPAVTVDAYLTVLAGLAYRHRSPNLSL